MNEGARIGRRKRGAEGRGTNGARRALKDLFDAAETEGVSAAG